jgi:hypothetical protein
VALKLIEEDAERMHKQTSQEPIAQVPQIACPDVAHVETANELRKDGFDAIAHPRQNGAVEQASQRRGSQFKGGVQPNTQTSQDDFEIGQPGVAIPNSKPCVPSTKSSTTALSAPWPAVKQTLGITPGQQTRAWTRKPSNARFCV